MGVDPDTMRVLIRRRTGQLYLQPSGAWTPNRRTARNFASSLLASAWAKEQRLLDAEILLAWADPSYDFVVLRTCAGSEAWI